MAKGGEGAADVSLSLQPSGPELRPSSGVLADLRSHDTHYAVSLPHRSTTGEL